MRKIITTVAAAASLIMSAVAYGQNTETPTLYILKDGKVVESINTAEIDSLVFDLAPGTLVPGKVIFYDNFEQAGRTPDPTKWRLCQKSSPAWARYLSESYDNAYVSNGTLKLTATKENGQYRCGGLETKSLFAFQYGRVDVSARFTKQAQGAWPAIWMMPDKPMWSGWPDCGEIDIMEHLNHDGFVYQTLHSYYRETLGISGGTVATPGIYADDFNVYSLIWTPECLTFLVNDQEMLTYNNYHLSDTQKQWPFDAPFYLIINHALGGEGTWPGWIDDSQLPATMEIDWVKVTELDKVAE